MFSITKNKNIETNNLLNKDLLIDYLEQLVLMKVDGQISEKQSDLDSITRILSEKKESVKSNKKLLLSKSRNLSKLNKISKILSLIDTLREEGRIIGNNKKKIFDLLEKINTLSINQLINIEEKLIIAIPEERSLTTFG
jgi:hypothetical protein